MNKWQAQIRIDGMNRHIGYYDNEEEAATDYARAVFKYKGQGALDKAREQGARDKVREQNSFIIDLSDVPPQPPIPKRPDHIKEGASKYKSRRGPQNTKGSLSTNQ
uniref:AP2/ERF domain-containing protein n=1 Tax=Skeletonema marinoi TaxID=267567 RepID=A0A7S2LTU9_9STRA|mmetsp:Transcript_29487/g.50293  ORF Transcript_29487/g.50293 Transcript_29487/m.50293 type:complete len:106 (+) Transcript_29487:228-545(+)